MPGLDGISVCRAIRRDTENSDTPILMLTARREEADKVLGFESGADDYLTKPFSLLELVARRWSADPPFTLEHRANRAAAATD